MDLSAISGPSREDVSAREMKGPSRAGDFESLTAREALDFNGSAAANSFVRTDVFGRRTSTQLEMDAGTPTRADGTRDSLPVRHEHRKEASPSRLARVTAGGAIAERWSGRRVAKELTERYQSSPCRLCGRHLG